jgi:hypothetical protein
MINRECSDSVDISIGSPQGSVLSPILFACFINDVGDHVRNCRFHLYADDFQIYTVDGCGDVNCLVALVNGDLQRILDWLRDNSLVLNASKTQALLVSRRIRTEDVGSDVFLGGDSVPLSDVVKNLGLYVDGRLSWRKQVSYVVFRTFPLCVCLIVFRDIRPGILESILCVR